MFAEISWLACLLRQINVVTNVMFTGMMLKKLMRKGGSSHCVQCVAKTRS